MTDQERIDYVARLIMELDLESSPAEVLRLNHHGWGPDGFALDRDDLKKALALARERLDYEAGL